MLWNKHRTTARKGWHLVAFLSIKTVVSKIRFIGKIKPKIPLKVGGSQAWSVQWRETKYVPFWKCNIFSRSGPILIVFLVKIRTDYKFFCTCFQVHRAHFEKVTSKNVFFHFFKNGKKHTHDTKNSSSQTLALSNFFNLWIRVQILDSYFFRYSKRDLESNWRF